MTPEEKKAGGPRSPGVGSVAPDFELRGTGGEQFRLSDYRGRRAVVLAFYPLAFSPVCGHQLPELNRHAARFSDHGAVLYGISVDSVFANEAFGQRLGLGFTLLSDFGRRASILYGVYDEARGYANRALIVISKSGVIIHREDSADSWDPADVPGIEEALAALAAAD